MPRTIPETPVVGKRWAELFRGRSWRVYEPPDRLVAADLSEPDARLLVEGPDRMAALESRLAEAVAMLEYIRVRSVRCPGCELPTIRGQHKPDCRLAALIANLEGG